jgi:hypothetical protein
MEKADDLVIFIALGMSMYHHSFIALLYCCASNFLRACLKLAIQCISFLFPIGSPLVVDLVSFLEYCFHLVIYSKKEESQVPFFSPPASRKSHILRVLGLNSASPLREYRGTGGYKFSKGNGPLLKTLSESMHNAWLPFQ